MIQGLEALVVLGYRRAKTDNPAVAEAIDSLMDLVDHIDEDDIFSSTPLRDAGGDDRLSSWLPPPLTS